MEKRIVSIASQLHRRSGLKRRIAEFLPQCDRINVCIEDADMIDSELWELEKNDKVNFHFTHKGLTSNGKFYCVSDSSGFYLTADDDISYPADYVERIVEGVERYGRKKIVSFQGTRFKHPIQSYYKSREKLDFRFTVLSDEIVEVAGTAVCGFHTDTIKLSLCDFPEKCMSDLQLGVAAKKQGVEIVCLQHTSGYLLPDLEFKDNVGILKQFYNNDEVQTRLARQFFNYANEAE